MKLYYHPAFNGKTYVKYTSAKPELWNEEPVGTAALLDQLLLRSGMVHAAAEKVDKLLEERREVYAKCIEGDWIRKSMEADSKATADRILEWRDALIMEGWTPEMTLHEGGRLQSLSEWEQKYAPVCIPGYADLWLRVDKALDHNETILKENDSIEVCLPSVLLPKLVLRVLKKLPNVSYRMETPDNGLAPKNWTIYRTKEQYEAWLALPTIPAENTALLVCSNSDRLSGTMHGLNGFSWDTEHAGCAHPTDDICNMLDTPDHLIWTDCVYQKPSAERLAFLTVKERETLKQLDVPSAEALSAAQYRQVCTLLNKINRIDFLCPQYAEGELLGEHPVITELKHLGLKFQETKKLPLAVTDIRTFSPQSEYNVDPQLVRNLKMNEVTQSPTALEDLYQMPFDYMLEKVCGLYAPEDDSATDLKIIYGKVAHKTVELMVKGHENDRRAVVAEMSNLPDHMSAAMEMEGQLLLQKEYTNERVLFEEKLKSSIACLMKIIDDQKLTPIGCEVEFTDAFDQWKKPHGYVDMVLTNEADQLVIFDFKYSERSDYEAYLAGNSSVQHIFYKHALKKKYKKEVAWYGYYLFPLNTLLTTQPLTPSTEGIRVVPIASDALTEDEFYKMMADTYAYRVAELNAGKLEEGEGMPIDSLSPSAATGIMYIPLKGAYDNAALKNTSYCQYKTKDELTVRPTMHSILKDHLK